MRNLAILLALVFLTSCAQVPKEHAYRLNHQAKMQASHQLELFSREDSCNGEIENRKRKRASFHV